MFKSDRCGIETYTTAGITTRTSMFKSDRCGIETHQGIIIKMFDLEFKSDRCGIETHLQKQKMLRNDYGSNQTVAGLKHVCAFRIVPN